MKIGYYIMQFDFRAASKSIYDYAHFNQTLLNNESIIIGTNKRELDTLPRFDKEFKTILIDEDYSPTDNTPIRARFERIVEDEKLDAFFISYEGYNYGMIPTNCKTLVQCVFTMESPHGSHYFGISEYLARKCGKIDFLPYIIHIPEPTENLRAQWGISEDAIVFGRHGGADSFHDMGSCKNTIKQIVNSDPNKYFVFINTNQFYEHKQIIYLPPTHDQQYISNFINSCDGMMHARNGETFGLAVGEFSWFNKPVLTFGGRQDDYAHLEILGNQALKYFDENSLWNLIAFWDKDEKARGKYDAYKAFGAKNVMEKFNDYLS